MPEKSTDIFLCIFDYKAAHLCRMSRLPSQLNVNSYHKIIFERPLKGSDLRSASGMHNLIQDKIRELLKGSPIDKVYITIPTTFGYVDIFRKEENFQVSENRELGKFLLENASGISADKLNYEMVEKNPSENWVFSLEKRIASGIQNLFTQSGLKTGAIILNAIVLENFLESVTGDETKVLMDFSDEFVELWIIDDSKSIAEWKLIIRNDLVGKEKRTLESRITYFLESIQSQYAIRFDKIHYSGLKDKNDINQLFQSNTQYNFTEVAIKGIGSIDPDIPGMADLKGDSGILVKIAGTTLSIN